MQPSLDGLNYGQKKAVITEGNTLVVACPGSGKTRVLQTKAHYLVHKHPGAKVVAVTFTADAAAELKERIAKVADLNQSERITTGTFHSLCKQQLIDSNIPFQLMSPRDHRSYVYQAIIRSATPFELDEAIGIIDNIKSKLVPDFNKKPENRALFEAYQNLLRTNGLFDFADLILTAVRGMQSERVKPLAANFLLVDESQDTDSIQTAWIACHLDAGIRVTMVGDDDQSVYSWRNAQGYAGMENFYRESSATKIVLDTNYRCKEEVLSAAERLIKNNSERMPKTLHADRGRGGLVEAYSFTNAEDEIEAVVEHIASAPQGWAVIARTNRILNDYERKFQERSIRVKRIGGKSLWDQPVVVLYINILLGLANVQHVGIENYLFDKGVDPDHIRVLFGTGVIQTGNIDAVKAITPRAAAAAMADLMGKTRHNHEVGCTLIVIQSCTDWMINVHLDKDEDEAQVNQIRAASRILKQMDGTLEHRLSIVERKKEEKEADPNEVALITMHGAKGLEYPKVWLPSSNDKICPSKKSGNIPEERRLYYVAMTRAKDELHISCKADSPSRFIAEANIHIAYA